MHVVNDFRLKLGDSELVPIVCGAMGVNFSGPELALEVCRLGGVGHLSDAMSMFVVDRNLGTSYGRRKARRFSNSQLQYEKPQVKFDPAHVYEAQLSHVRGVMQSKRGPGVVFLNVMEKLTMADPCETLRARLRAALDGGIDGITLSAGLHTHSFKLMEENARFREVHIGIIVSSCRALKIFLRSARAVNRLPDYIIVEGPLAGGHLGFGEDWRNYALTEIVREVLLFLKSESLSIPVIPAGGIFTGGDAVSFIEQGAAAVQVATRFIVTEECGISNDIKQKYFGASDDDIVVNSLSPTGYFMRMLAFSPCINSGAKPNCEFYGYMLNKEGKCQYLEEYGRVLGANETFNPVVKSKVCLCHHFARNSCYTCGQNASRLKDTTVKNKDGRYQLLTAEHVFRDYQHSAGEEIRLPDALLSPSLH